MADENLIPDFDELEDLAFELAAVYGNIVKLKNDIDMFEADLIVNAMEERDYWREGKRPTVTYCDRVVRRVGNTKEDKEKLDAMRTTLSELKRQKSALTSLIQIKRDKLDLYRTQSANERKGFL